jgi:hypothetical protein
VNSNPPGPKILATTGQATLVNGVFRTETFNGTFRNVCDQLG